MMSSDKVHCNSFLDIDTKRIVAERRICIMLNSEALQAEVSALIRLWDGFDLTICADGGANRLYDGLRALGYSNNAYKGKDIHEKYIPTHIKGDLDSLRPDVEAFYNNTKSCCIVRDNNQDTNDLQKCLELAKVLIKEQRTWNTCEGQDNDASTDDHTSIESKKRNDEQVVVVVFGAFGGRFDQQIASLHALYEYSTSFDRMVLLGDGNCATLLTGDSNSHTIKLVQNIEGPGCSLLPVGNRCDCVTTEGLKWNLNEQSMALGDLVSSSNQVTSQNVVIKTSHPLLWCCRVVLSCI